MRTRSLRRGSLPLVLLALASSTSAAGPASPGPALPPVSSQPTLTVTGGTAEQRERLDLAVARFGEVGLELPDLEVAFADPDGCDGHLGRFVAGPATWTVTFCTDLDFIYGHELAHAWEAANVDGATRAAFTAQQGLPVWADVRHPWRERGVEVAAFVVQQAVWGPALPLLLTDEHRSRLEGFELLTGLRHPRR